jgi:PAS domain S-box-containing protein
MKKVTAPRSSRAKKKAPPLRKTSRSRPPKRAPADAGAWDDLRAFQVLALHGGEIFSLIDASGKTLYRSPAAKRINYLTETEVGQSSFLEWIWPEDRKKVGGTFAEILENPGKSVSFQVRIRTNGADPVWIEGVGANFLNDPRVGAILVIFRDITEQERQQTTLKENEWRYQDLFERATLAIFQSNRDGKLLRCNPEFARLFGYESPEDVIRSIAHTGQLYADPARREEVVRLSTAVPPRSTFENLYRRKDGTTFWGLLNIHTVTDSAGGLSYFEGFIVDIDDRLRAENALRESEQRYRLLFENSPDSIAVYQEGKILFANPATLRLLGAKEPGEVIGRPVLDFVHPDCRKLVLERAREQERSGQPADTAAEKFLRRDGTAVDVEVIAAPFPYKGKTAHLVISRDITERKRAESLLHEKEERFRATFENPVIGVCVVGLDGRLLQVNEGMCRIFGYSREEFEAMTVSTIAFPEDAGVSSGFIQQAVAGGADAGEFDKRYLHKDGRIIWGHVSSSIVRDPAGAPLYFISHVQDVTERRRAENALRENEERYRSLFENSLEGVGLSQGNRVIDANPALLDIFGYESLEEFRAVSLLEHVAPESKAEISRRMDAKGDGGESRFQYRIVRKDGELRDLEISTDHVTIGGERFTLGTFRDVTESKRAEVELTALARRHATLLAAIPEIVMEVDPRKVYVWANPAGIEFFGPDVIGREAAEYFVGEQATYAEVQPLFNGDEDTVYLESWQRRKDGQKRLLAWWCRNLKDSRGEVIGALSSARDITEQREAAQEIEGLSRFPSENPNPVMRMSPEGRLLFANAASRPFLDLWRVRVGELVPKECRALIAEAYSSDAMRETQLQIGDRFFACTLAPVRPSGYLNVYGRDVTETKRAQDALARQAEELQQRNADLARLNDLTERRLQRLTALRAIDTAITSSFKLELVLNILLGQLADLIGAHAADILIYLPDLQTFRFSCGRGFRTAGTQQAYQRKTGSYANQATQDRRTVKVPALNEAADAARIYPRIAGEGFQSYLCLPLVAKGAIKGVLEVFQRAPLDLDPEEENFLEMVAGQAAIAIDNAGLFEGLQSTNDELTLAYNDTLSGWARTLELRTRGSGGEAQRLADASIRLARMLGAGEAELVPFYRGAVLHDIGMMGVPESILLKPGPLTEAEWELVRRHPQHAQDLLSSINYLRSAVDIPFCHHEKWDGSGYPRGLAGNQIPFAARVFAVVDVWDSMRSPRPYRPAHTDAEAREEIRRGSGTHFDPAVVKVFLESFAS